MFHGTSEKVSNAVILFENVRREGDKEGGSGEDDPEELLAHPDDAPDPGEEGEGLYGQLGPGLQNIKVDIQANHICQSDCQSQCQWFYTFWKVKSVMHK